MSRELRASAGFPGIKKPRLASRLEGEGKRARRSRATLLGGGGLGGGGSGFAAGLLLGLDLSLAALRLRWTLPERSSMPTEGVAGKSDCLRRRDPEYAAQPIGV
jgi:hypothetical protein